MLHRGLFAEVTVTSVEHPPSVSHRGILNTNQRLSHTKQRLSRLSTLSSTYSYTNHRFSVLFPLCLLLPPFSGRLPPYLVSNFEHSSFAYKCRATVGTRGALVMHVLRSLCCLKHATKMRTGGTAFGKLVLITITPFFTITRPCAPPGLPLPSDCRGA